MGNKQIQLAVGIKEGDSDLMAEVAGKGRAGSLAQLECQHIWKQSHRAVGESRGGGARDVSERLITSEG